jgi:hypothetical protein
LNIFSSNNPRDGGLRDGGGVDDGVDGGGG